MNIKNAINQCTYETTIKHSHYSKPSSIEDLIEIITHLKGDYHVISKGKNWGYGSKLGMVGNTHLLDLSELREIELDEKLGCIKLQAGVTQEDVYTLLKTRNSDYMLSITGSSRDSSIIGNIVNHGYGNGKSTIRMNDVIQVNGFTSNGKYIEGINQSTCKYGSQSKLFELFAPNNKTIISEVKLQLSAIPSQLVLVFFSLSDKNQFASLTDTLIDFKKQGLIEGNWSIFSAHRLLAEANLKSTFVNNIDTPLSDKEAQELLFTKCNYKTWTGIYNGVFPCYVSSKELAFTTIDFIKSKIEDLTDQLEFLTVSKEKIINERNCGNGFNHIEADLPILSRLRTFSGILQNGSIDISYWRMHTQSLRKDLDYDGCGFIWLAMSCCNNSLKIQTAVETIKQEMKKAKLDPIIVIDGVENHETYIMTSIIYNRTDLDQERLSKKAFKNTIRELNSIGLVNYRKPTPWEE